MEAPPWYPRQHSNLWLFCGLTGYLSTQSSPETESLVSKKLSPLFRGGASRYVAGVLVLPARVVRTQINFSRICPPYMVDEILPSEKEDGLLPPVIIRPMKKSQGTLPSGRLL